MSLFEVLWLLVPVLIVLAAWRINKTLQEIRDATRENGSFLLQIKEAVKKPEADKFRFPSRLPGE